jgi:hypothetical protein
MLKPDAADALLTEVSWEGIDLLAGTSNMVGCI